MTGIAVHSPASYHRSAGNAWVAFVALFLAVLAAGAFALGRVTHSDGSSGSTTRTVWMQSVPGTALGSACHVKLPC